MSGRHLRLPSSSDEDDDVQRPPLNPNPIPPLSISDDDPSLNPNPNSPLVISDDDFADASDVLSDPSPPSSGEPMEVDYVGFCPIGELLARLGLRLRPEWLAFCAAGLVNSGSGFERLDVAGKAKLCFEQFLLSDMNCSGAGVLPTGVSGMHKAELEGPFVLQVDEVINISSPLRERYHEAPAGLKRFLKLSLTDGVQRVFGMEYRSIRELGVLASAGFKIVIRNVQIRRGLLMLVPEVLEVLGGMVESLEAAHKRLADEVNKPARGKRKQFLLPLAKRASLAAWSSDTPNSTAQANISTTQSPNYPQPTAQADTMATTSTVSGETIIEAYDNRHSGGRMAPEPTWHPNEGSAGEELAASITRGSIIDEHASATISITPEPTGHPNEESVGVELAVPITRGSITDVEEALQASATIASGSIADVDDSYNLNATDASGSIADVEVPFTYLASLLAKWATQMDSTPFIQGKIKCFLTSVKGFQFKQRSTYDLRVYVDDGSLISEVIIDHQVVQKGIGLSPVEVTTALSSSDKKAVADTRESMMKFQHYLAKFEGTMLVEINNRSPLPVALEMDQGCSTSDALLLLRRLKKSTVPHELEHNNLRPINLSP